jgi:LPXTG-motif cell wall-anchored protein
MFPEVDEDGAPPGVWIPENEGVSSFALRNRPSGAGLLAGTQWIFDDDIPLGMVEMPKTGQFPISALILLLCLASVALGIMLSKKKKVTSAR